MALSTSSTFRASWMRLMRFSSYIDFHRYDKSRPHIGVCQYVGVPKMPKVSPSIPCCAPLSAEAVPGAVARRVAASFKALSEPARLRLLSLIQAQPGGEAWVCHLIAPLGLAQPTVTHHLQAPRRV